MPLPNDAEFKALEALLSKFSTKEMADGFSVAELAVKTGKGIEWIREQLRKLDAAGYLIAGRKKVKAIDGRMVWIAAYKVRRPETPQEDEKGKKK
jgi:hypothetical protein